MNCHMTLTLSLRFAAKQYRTGKHEGTQQNNLSDLIIIIRHSHRADWSHVFCLLYFGIFVLLSEA